MKILAVVTGEYGRRIANHVREFGPSTWSVEQWTAPSHFPIVIDDPRDFMPKAPAPDQAVVPAAPPTLPGGKPPGPPD